MRGEGGARPPHIASDPRERESSGLVLTLTDAAGALQWPGGRREGLNSEWAKILWAVLQSGTLSDEARHLARLHSKGVVWAKDLPGGA